MEINTARMIRGDAISSSRRPLPSFRILQTIKRSRLKIIRPHRTAKKAAIHTLSKMVYKAYPPEAAANSPVKKIVAPMPTYLLVSEGHFSRMRRSAPEHHRKKSVIFCMQDKRRVIQRYCMVSQSSGHIRNQG